ncbi:S8 family serine peptidase [Cellulomonas citrea]|uniref:S8 family serine peptidase n=1 Tax=Cellulomonas citrea TaxID=1909423 RepID=UPI00135A936F|nr:S8 family serine peptidase [Cellulomonas citrea]
MSGVRHWWGLRPRGTAVAALLAVGLMAGVGPASAGAASVPVVHTDPADGTWWYDALDGSQLAALGATGAGVEVAVVDAGISPTIPLLADARLTVYAPATCLDEVGVPTSVAVGSELSDATSHGTNIVGMIAGSGAGVSGVAPDADVSFYATAADDWTPCVRDADGGDVGFAQAVVHAVDDGARILSLSIGTLDTPTRAALAWALHQGVVVVAAIGNFDGDDDTLPMVNGLVAVQAEDADQQPEGTGTSSGPVRHDHVTVTAPGIDLRMQGNLLTGSWAGSSLGTGTSFAAPLVAGLLADLAQRYPRATGNQLVQDLVATAFAPDGADPAVVGYGQVDPVRMLQLDPTTLPDVNPLLADQPHADGDLTPQDVAAATRPDLPDVGWTSVEAATASDPAPASVVGAQRSGPTQVHAAAVGLAVGAVALGAVGLRRRRRRKPAASGDPHG